MLESSKSIVLRYDPGQFTFSQFDHAASDEQMYDLAMLLNAFQTCEADKVLKVTVFEF
jgi:hypothetical protein